MKLDIEREMTLIIYSIDFRPLKRRATLKTLKTLKILTALKADNAPLPLMKMSSTKLKITIVPSI